MVVEPITPATIEDHPMESTDRPPAVIFIAGAFLAVIVLCIAFSGCGNMTEVDTPALARGATPDAVAPTGAGGTVAVPSGAGGQVIVSGAGGATGVAYLEAFATGIDGFAFDLVGPGWGTAAPGTNLANIAGTGVSAAGLSWSSDGDPGAGAMAVVAPFAGGHGYVAAMKAVAGPDWPGKTLSARMRCMGATSDAFVVLLAATATPTYAQGGTIKCSAAAEWTTISTVLEVAGPVSAYGIQVMGLGQGTVTVQADSFQLQ